jgi:hypothetical protein
MLSLFPEPPERRLVPRTRLSWGTVAEWCLVATDMAQRVVPAERHYRRMERLYRSLTLDEVRACSDRAALRQINELFDPHIRSGGGDYLYWPPWRVFTRAELAEYRIQAHNRLVALKRRRKPHKKGPRFDPALMPDAVLERLIQRHPDPAVVDRLREERTRRAAN